MAQALRLQIGGSVTDQGYQPDQQRCTQPFEHTRVQWRIQTIQLETGLKFIGITYQGAKKDRWTVKILFRQYDPVGTCKTAAIAHILNHRGWHAGVLRARSHIQVCACGGLED